MKSNDYSPTLQAILQGAKFKSREGINGVLHTYQLEEIAASLWLVKFKSGKYRTETNFSVDKVLTKGEVLVLETSVLGKRCEVRIEVKDVELLNEQ